MTETYSLRHECESNKLYTDSMFEHIQSKKSSGPIYVCTVCLQTWFRTSVHDVANLTFKSQLEKRAYLECSQGYVSAGSKEWLCKSCRLVIKREQWPKLFIINGMDFPVVPTE